MADSERHQQRLDDIQDDIDRQRAEADEPEGDIAAEEDTEPRFSQTGEANGPVDDTIAPFG